MLMRHAGTPVLSGVYEMVGRHGYAPCTAGCKPADLLTNLAAQKDGETDGVRTRSGRFTACNAD